MTAFSVRSHLQDENGEPIHLTYVMDRRTDWKIVNVYIEQMTVHLVLQLVPETPSVDLLDVNEATLENAVNLWLDARRRGQGVKASMREVVHFIQSPRVTGI